VLTLDRYGRCTTLCLDQPCRVCHLHWAAPLAGVARTEHLLVPPLQDDTQAQQQLAAGILHQLLMTLLDAPAGRFACAPGLRVAQEIAA